MFFYRRLTIPWTAWILAALATLTGCRTQPRIPDYYQQANGARFPILISRTEIGIVPLPGIRTAEALTALGEFRLGQPRSGGGNLLVLSTPETLDRAGLVRLTRNIAAKSRGSVAQVGMVVRTLRGKDTILATDEFIAKVRAGTPADAFQKLNRDIGAEVVMENPFAAGQFLLRVLPAVELDSFGISQRYLASGLVEFAFPNFITPARDQQVATPPMFQWQWAHQNVGQKNKSGDPGTPDADADTLEAWGITQGASTTIIAIVENQGFDFEHPDLAPNLWVNPGETAGNGIDDDGNGFVDDIYGWNFEGCIQPQRACGNNVLLGMDDEPHGTAVAGIAAAHGRTWGACPNCRLMFLRTGPQSSSDWAKSLAIDYAVSKGAQVINNSWDADASPLTLNAIETAAANGRGGLGTVVVFASGNTVANRCNPEIDPLISSPSIIPVSGSTNQDRKVKVSATGGCIAVLAPSHRGFNSGDPYTGTLNVTTTDRRGDSGYNNSNKINLCPSDELADENYTRCFDGTSAAAPLVAGVAGLVLTVRPSLTRVDVRRLLQDTADRIEPGVAQYSPITGQSAPQGSGPTHAFGRINAFEAVRIAAPPANGGKDGVDIFVRDNALDWGNTEQPSYTLFEATRGIIRGGRSPDIKADVPPLKPTPANNMDFDAFAGVTPQAGKLNRIYVRVRNRGPVAASAVTVKLQWAAAPSGLPPLPSDFWSAFPADSANTSVWHPVMAQTFTSVNYSGSSVVCTAADAAPVAFFDVSLPQITPNPGRLLLLVTIDSPQDRVSPKTRATVPADFLPEALAAIDNNVTYQEFAWRP